MAIAAKTFNQEDQARFTALSGDSNPIHADSIVARRTAAGAPVVHGIHTLLWLVDAVAVHRTEIAGIAALKARFHKMVYLGERVEGHITELSARKFKARATIDGVEILSVVATIGIADAAQEPQPGAQNEPLQCPITPYEPAWEHMQGTSGRVPFAARPAEMERMFPGAARLLGARRVAALGCSSYLVGMVVPGLHSIYVSLALHATDHAAPQNELRYVVSSVDPRFRRVDILVAGGGLSGTLGAIVRPAPVFQASIEHAAAHVEHSEFAASTALVVGGSRGIGEVTAKLIAAGGGKVVVTYATGRVEAEKVAAEITRWGGSCTSMRYDIHDDAATQLEALEFAPTHIYYFATPTILKRKLRPFTAERFGELNVYFIQGFFNLVEAALRLRPTGVSVFYPSSQFVIDRPAGMTEYAMSKAAAEVLCADMGKLLPGAIVTAHRLPRVLTDQTAALGSEQAEDPLPIMVPIIRRMHSPDGRP